MHVSNVQVQLHCERSLGRNDFSLYNSISFRFLFFFIFFFNVQTTEFSLSFQQAPITHDHSIICMFQMYKCNSIANDLCAEIIFPYITLLALDFFFFPSFFSMSKQLIFLFLFSRLPSHTTILSYACFKCTSATPLRTISVQKSFFLI